MHPKNQTLWECISKPKSFFILITAVAVTVHRSSFILPSEERGTRSVNQSLDALIEIPNTVAVLYPGSFRTRVGDDGRIGKVISGLM